MGTSQVDAGGAVEWIRRIHASHGGALHLFARRALGDEETAQEVVQDTLVRAWRNADRFDPHRGSLDTWLFAIARNLIVDQHRRRRVRPRVTTGLDDLDEASLADAATVDRALDAWQVSEAIQRISPDHRAVIVETYYRGASVAEAAQRLDVPQGTVKSRLYYGLRALRLVLEEMGVVE